MIDFFRTLYELIITTVTSSSALGPILACFLIVVESILPMLPLFVFITVVFISYGYVIGFILSWAFTIIGCLLAYVLVKYVSTKWIKTNNKKLKKLVKRINKITLPQLVLLIAIPFTPAFMINIAAGLSKIPFKKYFVSLLIGKVSLVAFWGFIGTSLIESLKDPITLVKVGILVLVVYIISKIVNSRLKIS